MSQNRLKDSASPYLRSAAHQPIDWYEWGDGAFERARAEDKPLLLDIGAVWCHWCHVIDRESYENSEIAKIINEHFVPVKVDRDERPDVDSRYQSAISAISGQGGWPLTGFLMPDGRPFYGGTYFPPVDQQGRPSFRRVLLAVAEAYKNKREELAEDRRRACGSGWQRRSVPVAPARNLTSASSIRRSSSMKQLFDTRHGGFGRAPKFPHASAVEILLERYRQTGEKHLLGYGRNHPRKNGRRRRLRSTRRGLPSLFRRRTLACAALRKDELRQFGTAEELPPRLASNPQSVSPRNCRRHHRVGERSLVRSAERRILCQPGRGLFLGR